MFPVSNEVTASTLICQSVSAVNLPLHQKAQIEIQRNDVDVESTRVKVPEMNITRGEHLRINELLRVTVKHWEET